MKAHPEGRRQALAFGRSGNGRGTTTFGKLSGSVGPSPAAPNRTRACKPSTASASLSCAVLTTESNIHNRPVVVRHRSLRTEQARLGICVLAGQGAQAVSALTQRQTAPIGFYCSRRSLRHLGRALPLAHSVMVMREAVMDARVRKAGLGDEGVLAVMNRVVERKDAARAGGDVAAPVSTRFVVDRFHMLLRRSSVRAWVAERDGETVGYVLAQFYCRRFEQSKEAAVPVGVVEQLVVYCEEDERCALVKQLLAEVYKQARSEALRHVELNETVVDYLKRCGADPSRLNLTELDNGQ